MYPGYQHRINTKLTDRSFKTGISSNAKVPCRPTRKKAGRPENAVGNVPNAPRLGFTETSKHGFTKFFRYRSLLGVYFVFAFGVSPAQATS